MSEPQSAAHVRRHVPFTDMNLDQRRRLAISLIVFICCMLVVLVLFGFGAMVDFRINWVLVFAWSVPISAAIALAVHLINFVFDTAPSTED